jgi:hypothetical protein
MRIYGTKYVEAYIRQKHSVEMKYGKPVRPLTADDFEIVPAHEEEQLIEVRCNLCGVMAEHIWDEDHTSLVSLEVLKGSARGYDNYNADFLGEDWYEVCEDCMRNTIAPYLQSLQRIRPPEPRAETPEDESAVLPDHEVTAHRQRMANGPLIGEDDGVVSALHVPPISEDEPF